MRDPSGDALYDRLGHALLDERAINTPAGTDDFDLWAGLIGADGAPEAMTTIGGNRDDRGLGLAVDGGRRFVVSGMAQPADTGQLIADGRVLFIEAP